MEKRRADRAAVETLWREVSRMPNTLSCALGRPTWNGWDRLTNPGYVGRDFDGVIFLAKNPGNGAAQGPTPLEHTLFSALDAMRRGEPTFDAFCDAYRAGLESWAIGRYLADARAPLECIAFLNLVPWRTAPSKMNTAAWREAAASGHPILVRQLALLRPREIVVLGMSTKVLLERMPSFGAASIMIERSNGDSFTKPAAAAALADLRRRMGW